MFEFIWTDNHRSTEMSSTPRICSNETVGHDTDDRPKVHSSGYGGSTGVRGSYQIKIDGLDTRELELLQGALHGHQWVRCVDGRIENIPSYEPLPAPEADEMMMPFWRPPMSGVETQLELFPFDKLPDYSLPSITIQHLCGYNYSPENYRFQAEQLQRWGFVCLRSRRNDNGKFWEIWQLGCLSLAKEEFKTAIDTLDYFSLQRATAEEFLLERLSPPKPRIPKSLAGKKRRQLDVAVSFLCRNAQFGTLDVSYQRAAMGTD